MDPDTTFLVIVETQEPASAASNRPSATTPSDVPRIVGIHQAALLSLMRHAAPRVQPVRPAGLRTVRIRRREIISPFGSLPTFEECNLSTLLQVSDRILVKVPLYTSNSSPRRISGHSQRAIDRSFERMRREQLILDTVLMNPHPNLIAPLCIIGQGTFLPILKECILDRLERDQNANEDTTPANQRLRLRWVKQIASALAWFESIQYVHGAVDTTHIMLDHHDNIKLIDFGNSVPVGTMALGDHHPFLPRWLYGVHSHQSEQWAFAWAVCEIYQDESLDDYDIPGGTIDLDTYPFPSLEGSPFASIARNAWRLRYTSMAALSRDVKRVHDENMPRLHRLAFAAKDARDALSERWKMRRMTREAEEAYLRLMRQGTYGLCFVMDLERAYADFFFACRL